jgi:hypothetical protein
MEAVPAARVPGPPTGRSAGRVRRTTTWLALALLLLGVQSKAHEPVPAVWKERKTSFTYVSATAVYSCDALEARVASILRAIGARDDVKVRASNCSEAIVLPGVHTNDPGGWNSPVPTTGRPPDRHTDHRQSAVVYIRAMVPIEVTEEVLAELKRDKSRRELVSRVTGDPAARFNDPIMFWAQRQPVELSHKTIGIEPEECELLDQLSASVLPELGVGGDRNLSCDRSGTSRIRPELVVESLRAAPYGTGNAQQPPATGDDDSDPGLPAPAEDDSGKPAAEKTSE